MKIKPLHGNVFIEPFDVTPQTKSGIILQDDKKLSRSRGRVVAVGPDVIAVKENDSVIFKPNHPHEVTIGDTVLLVAKVDDIVGIIS